MEWGIQYSWIGRLDTVKVCIFPKMIYEFNSTLVKIPSVFWEFLVEFHRLILKFMQECNGPKIT